MTTCLRGHLVLPITGWNTQGGDLRIGHFLGVHALQLILMLALGLG
jgi:hypothetical protein